MAAVESSNQNDSHTTSVLENGSSDKTTMEKNGHVEDPTSHETKSNNVDSSVSSSVDGSQAVNKDKTAGENHVESSTEGKHAENGKNEEDARGDKRQLDETDTVAKKVARMENGEQTIGKHQDLTGNAEPVVEPDSESNGKKHDDTEKDNTEIKADTGKDVGTVDQEVVGQGTAV